MTVILRLCNDSVSLSQIYSNDELSAPIEKISTPNYQPDMTLAQFPLHQSVQSHKPIRRSKAANLTRNFNYSSNINQKLMTINIINVCVFYKYSYNPPFKKLL